MAHSPANRYHTSVSNNDALSRRDAGLEFLNATWQLRTDLTRFTVKGTRQEDVYIFISTSPSTVVDTHLR